MRKKIKIAGLTFGIVITGIIIAGILLINLNQFENTNSNAIESIIKPEADVVIPTKVSRPGCEMTDSCYSPSKIVITTAKSVTWINEDAAFHSVTSGFYDAPTDLFDSGYLDPEESFTFHFDRTGTFDYFCTLHPWMKGQVIVESN